MPKGEREEYSNSNGCDNTEIRNRKQAIRSRQFVLPDGVRPACVSFEDGRITAIDDFAAVPEGVELFNFAERAVLPGLIDTHIHINEPGRTEWEGFATATRAAAAGGYTCVVDMPLNSIPATTTVDALEKKRVPARGTAMVDYGFWGGLVAENFADLEDLITAGVHGFKAFMVPSGVAEFSMAGETELRRAMPVIAKSGLPLLVHAEVPGPIEAADGELVRAGAVWSEYRNYLRSRPDEAELQAIRLLIALCREYRCRVHIVHLASALALPELAAARTEGLPITVETCPHYLFFSSEEIPAGATQYKCAPPIRNEENQERLWAALAEGCIDLIATDHSPCPPEMKHLESGSFREAWGGIASVSLALAAVWTKASARGCSLKQIAYWMCEQPALLAGIHRQKGSIALGLDADFAIFDPDIEWKVRTDDLHFRHKLSPYLGKTLKGRVESTFVRGECVYRDGGFPAKPIGKECQRVQ